MQTRCTFTVTEATKVEVAPPKKHYVKILDFYSEEQFKILTDDQLRLLKWLSECGIGIDWDEIDPNSIFEEI